MDLLLKKRRQLQRNSDDVVKDFKVVDFSEGRDRGECLVKAGLLHSWFLMGLVDVDNFIQPEDWYDMAAMGLLLWRNHDNGRITIAHF